MTLNLDLIKPNNTKDIEIKPNMSLEKAKQTAQDFQNMFISFLYNIIDEMVEVDPMFGGGIGEKIFKSLERDEIIKKANPDFGLEQKILEQILKSQEIKE